jgi:6-phosphogluconolactonase/glucosamine-6-phosphate isomerase/deaminase
MEFIKTEGTHELVTALSGALIAALKQNLRVLWLVPGGSNIHVAVEVMAKIPEKDTHRLTVMLTDERYGEIGHENSNYYQLKQAGFVEHEARFIQTLSGSSFDETLAYAEKVTEKLFSEAGSVIGFFGMGADGHVAGILPHSPAATAQSWVSGYDGGQHQRITLTPFALSHLSMAIVGAFGAEKRPELERLCHQQLPVAEQPAQLLKHIPKVQIFNDQIRGDE